jgi:hypothetical protein
MANLQTESRPAQHRYRPGYSLLIMFISFATSGFTAGLALGLAQR